MNPSFEGADVTPWPNALERDLLRFFTIRLRCRELASELMQETLLRLYQKVQCDAVENPRAMAFRIAEHLSIDHQRRTAVRSRYGGEENAESFADSVACPKPGPEEIVASRQRLELLSDLLAELPPDCRSAFLLHGVEGLSYAEIAEHLGISKSMVGKHLARAILHCKQRLND